MRLLTLFIGLNVLATFAVGDEITAEDMKKFMVQSKMFAYKSLKFLVEHNDLLIFKGIEFIKYISELRQESKFDPKNLEHQFSRINLKLDKISEDLKIMENELLAAHENYADIAYLESRLQQFYDYVFTINERYNIYTNDLTNPNKTFFKLDYESFNVEVLENGYNGINEILTSIHEVLLSTKVRPINIFAYIAEMRLKKVTMCMRLQSLQQYIYDLLEIAIAAETKGLIMTISAIEYQKKKENAAGTDNTARAKERFQNRTTDIYNEAIKIGAHASRDIWRCDRRYGTKGVTYATIGPLFQKYIMHESDGIGNLCFESCPQGKFVNLTLLKCRSEFCKPLRDTRYFCNGNVRDCDYHGWDMKVCLSDSDDRRYEYINSDGEIHGRQTSCSNEVNAQSWSSGFYKCHYCVCTCDESGNWEVIIGESKNINNYFSLNTVQSDLSDNKVVTGARLQLVDNIFSIQIEQGKIVYNSQLKIDPVSVDWKNESQVYNKKEDVPSTLLKLDWDFRGICLDDVQLTKDYVVTGLRFEKGLSHAGNYECIKLAVQASKVHYNPNKKSNIELGPQIWFNEEGTVTKRSEYKFQVPDVPTSYSDHEPNFNNNLFIKFTTSDFKKDAGQNVIPFFDIQRVFSSTPAPLSGIGLIHKNRKNSAGYISFKITTYDVTESIEAPEVPQI